MKPTIVLILCCAAAAQAVHADEIAPVPVGTRMRITTSGAGGFTGTSGAVLGAVALGSDTGSGCSFSGDFYQTCNTGTAAEGALVMGVMGAGIGALIGHSHRVEHWTDVGVERVHLQVAPVARGAQVAVSLRLGR